MVNLSNNAKAKAIRHKAQTMLEYALIIGATVGAILTMFHFYGRSIQGKIKESVDNIGGQFVANSKSNGVYMPGHSHSNRISSAMRRTSSGVSFHTGLLPLGMTIGLSAGRSVTTDIAQISTIEEIQPHDPITLDQDKEVAKARSLVDKYGSGPIDPNAVKEDDILN